MLSVISLFPFHNSGTTQDGSEAAQHSLLLLSLSDCLFLTDGMKMQPTLQGAFKKKLSFHFFLFFQPHDLSC